MKPKVSFDEVFNKWKVVDVYCEDFSQAMDFLEFLDGKDYCWGVYGNGEPASERRWLYKCFYEGYIFQLYGNNKGISYIRELSDGVSSVENYIEKYHRPVYQAKDIMPKRIHPSENVNIYLNTYLVGD